MGFHIVNAFALLLLSSNWSSTQCQIIDDSYRLHERLEKLDTQIGDLIRDGKELKPAIDIGKTNVEYFKQSASWSEYYYARNQVGHCLRRARLQEEARTYLDSTIEEMGALSEYRLELARANRYLGEFHEYSSKNNDSAERYYRKSVELFEGATDEIHDDRVRIYRVIGRFYQRRRQDFNESRYFHAKEVAIQEVICDSNDIDLGRSYLLLGIALREMKHILAEGYLKKALVIYDEAIRPIRSHKTALYNSLGNTLFDKQKFEEAIQLYGRAIDYTEKANAHSPNLILPYSNLASSQRNLNLHEEAYVNFHKALSIPPGSEMQRRIEAFMQLGEYFMDVNLMDSAISVFTKVINYNELYDVNHLDVSRCLRYKAQAYLEQDSLLLALATNEQALKALEIDYNRNDLDIGEFIRKVDHPEQLVNIFAQEASIYLQMYLENGDTGTLHSAIETYSSLDDFIDITRRGPYAEAVKRDNSIEFETIVEKALLSLHHLQKAGSGRSRHDLAFDLMEKNRYTNLFNQIIKAQNSLGKAVLDSLYDKEIEITSKIDAISQRLNRADSSARAKVQEERFNLYLEHDRFREEVANKYPSYFKLNYDDIHSLSKIQKMLGPRTQVIEFFWGKTDISAIAFNNKESRLIKIPISGQLFSNIIDLQKSLSKFDNTISLNSSFKKFSELTYEIYENIVKPLLWPETKQLILSTDGMLSGFPLGILVTDLEGRGFRDANYLMKDYDISYAFSTNLHFRTNPGPVLKNPSFLGLSYSDGDEELSNSHDFSEIPESAIEINRIAKLFENSTIFTGDEATESNFKDQSSKYDIIHLAVHGLPDTVYPVNSCLQFKYNLDRGNDGKLHAHELYDLDLNNLRLAVLSACKTGVGKEYPGEGIYSIARGFAYTKSPSVIMSLWNADDVTTADVMARFYTNLKRGQSISRALQRAKLGFLHDVDHPRLTHPYYWASFVQLGNGLPIMKGNIDATFWIIGISLMLILYFTMKKL